MNDLDSLSVRDLRSVVVLADRLHFGRASEELGVAQPSLSAAIKKVEALCGELLFERTSRQVSLTPAGQWVVQRARMILEEVERLGRGSESGRLLAGRFRLGLLPTIGPYYAPEFLRSLRLEYPQLELVLVEAVTASLVQMLRQRQLDAAVLCLPSGERGLTETPLFRETFLLAAPVGHALAELQEIELWQIDPKQMILMERGHCLREQALEACGVTPETATGPMQAASIETLRHLVAAGHGCAVLPSMAVRSGNDCRGLVTYIPFRGVAPSRTVGLVFDERCARLEDAVELGRFLKRLAVVSTGE